MIQKKFILLIQPWVEDFYATDCRIQPIGLAYLAGSIKQRLAQFDVMIYDALAGGARKTIPWPLEFIYLKKYYGQSDSGPFSLFHQFYRFGKREQDIKNDLRNLQPLLIGISSLFTPYYRQSLEMGLICRQLFPNVPIVMGGSHATLHPESLLRPYKNRSVCDFILPGEAEDSICDLLEMLLGDRAQADVSRLIVKNGIDSSSQKTTETSRVLETEDSFTRKSSVQIDNSLPDISSLRLSDYTYDGKPMSFLITSRSCPHRCTFCSIHSVFGKTYRVRRVEDILSEIKFRYGQGIRHFDIEDDNFTVNKKEILRVLDQLIILNLPISFSAMNGLSYISLNKEILIKMRKAGFSSLNLALVSSDKLVLEFTNRPHTLKKFIEIVDIASDLDFRITAYFILGMPKQTVVDMWNTLCTLAQSKCLIGASPFYFTPGSPIHVKEKDNPSIRLASNQAGGDHCFSARLTALDLETAEFDRDDIYTLFRLTRLLNYVKKGLDLNLSIDNIYFSKSSDVLRTGEWYAETKNGRHPLPFSKKITKLIKQKSFVIRGFRTNNYLIWNPAIGHFSKGTVPVRADSVLIQ